MAQEGKISRPSKGIIFPWYSGSDRAREGVALSLDRPSSLPSWILHILSDKLNRKAVLTIFETQLPSVRHFPFNLFSIVLIDN